MGTTQLSALETWRRKAFNIHARYVGTKWQVNGDTDKRFLALALCGEVGELANLVKKEWRGEKQEALKVWQELADIRIYLELLACAFDCDLDFACQVKLKEVEKRLVDKQSD